MTDPHWQQPQPPNQPQPGPGQYPPYYYAPAPEPEKKSNIGIIILGFLLTLLLVGGAVLATLYFTSKDSSSASEETPMTLQQSQEAEVSTPQATVTETVDVPAPDRERNKDRTYTSYERGTSVTSKAFARAVYSAFQAEYDGDPNITLHDVYSSATGKYYTMRCSEEGSTVVCRGGNNAVVKIY